MPNGAAIALRLVPEIASSEAVTKDKPAAAPAAIEVEIGEATRAAVIAIAMAVDDHATGGAMTPATRAWTGAMLGRMSQLRLDTIGLSEFNVIAYREGRRALRACPDRVLLARFGAGQVDAVIDELIGYVVTIAEHVARDELALRSN